jgi:probable rRNA maturation factor
VTPPLIQIDIVSRQDVLPCDEAGLRRAMTHTLTREGVRQADLSVAIVDDPEIHRVNREFLHHDFPTDVISFLLSDLPSGRPGNPWPDDWPLEGELVISASTAALNAPQHGWSPGAELILYAVHGLLHLCGYDDLTDDARPLMRIRERELLTELGLLDPATVAVDPLADLQR